MTGPDERVKRLYRGTWLTVRRDVDQVTGVRSNLWPGATAVMAKGAFTNVYIGWGLKNEKLVPPPPPAVNGEWAPPLDDEGNATFLLQESTELPPPPPVEGEGDEEDE
jgi:hypothetical protein